MLQLTYELRPKWNKNKSQNAVSRSDPLQGSDKNSHKYPKSDLQNSGTFRCFFLGEQPENTENIMKSSENI